jgi:hypothetical protein
MTASVPLLRAALHWRIEPPFAPELDWLGRVVLAGRLVGAQCVQACERADFVPQTLILNSTMLSLALTMPGTAATAFRNSIGRESGLAPAAIVSAYQCAAWGFTLRHLARHTGLRRVAIGIVDLDLHDMAWQREHPVIGPSGFGLTTLLLETPAGQALPQCSGPHPNSAFNEFLLAMRAHQRMHGVVPTFLPFVRGPLAATASVMLAREALAPNRHADLGHCFGADPWIGLIERFTQEPAPRGARVLAGAIAFNGYYTLSDIGLGPATALGFERRAGDTGALHRFLSSIASPHAAATRALASSLATS